ncbi:MAG TPA: DUF5689 domain-containing protein [Chitinophagaceae bacterium]|nr:DUF5689 domain-containing protein [Chitinophagaceae bacterium]
MLNTIQKIAQRVLLTLTAGVLFLSCDKEPIGPTGPDPLGPGDYLSFAAFRALYPGSGEYLIPTGTKRIRGQVISNNTNEAAGVYRLQDESGAGIYLYTVIGSPVYPMGSVLDINATGGGKLLLYNGDLELMSVPQANIVLVSGTINIAPRVATIAEIITNKNTWASSLVKINNVTSITQASSNSTGVTYNVTDATGTLSMFVRNASGITVNTSGTSITGYVSIYNTTTQIGIRTAADIQ